MLQEASKDTRARIADVGIWYECALKLGAHSPQCESLAGNIVNLGRIWSAELIMTLPGVLTFLLEISSR